MPRGRGGRGGNEHNYQGSSHLYVPNSKREQPTTAPATKTTTTTPWQSEKPVCRFFQRGQCSKGEKCTFPHPADQEGIHARTEAANPFTAGQKNSAPGGLPCSGASGNRRTTGGPPDVLATSNAGGDVHMCDCSGDQAQELATLRRHLAATKHIIETLCEGNQTLTSRAIEMVNHYGLKL